MVQNNNIILIGMPGSGKSTVGIILAKMTSRGFLDTDLLIQNTEYRALQEIVDCDGYLKLRAIEEKILLSISGNNQVIATGGSAVYSEPAMKHLGSFGIIVFLNVGIQTLLERVKDYETRGLAKRPDQNLEELFKERSVLYEKYADLSIPCDAIAHEAVCKRIIEQVGAL